MDNPLTPVTPGTYYPYPQANGDQEYERCQQSFRILQERRQRLAMSLQTNPYQRNELESQLRVVDRDLHQLQQQMAAYAVPPQPIMDHHHQQHPYSYGPPKGGNPYLSPADSAIGSGVPSGVASSVQSGVQTKAHSEVAPGDLEQFDGDDGAPQQPFGSHAVSSRMQQTSAERIRMTMFPDTIQEGEEVPSTQVAPGQQSNLQRLAHSAQVLKTAVSALTTYQGSTELTAKALPDIAKLLQQQNRGDNSTISEAAKLMNDLTKKEASCKAVISNGHVVRTMVQAMVSTHSLDVQKSLAGGIHNISGDRRGLQMIYNSSGIPCLAQLLTSQVDAVLFYAITTLHNMLLHYEPAKMDVRLAGGLEKMVALLVKDNPKFLAITVDCLHLLAYGHQDSKLIILASGGPVNLVRIMRLYSYEKLLWTCSRLLKVLSVCPSNKPEIVQAGGMQALSRHLGHRSTRLVHNILHTLRNLSDMATKQDHLDDLLRQLIVLLSSNDVTTVTCTAGVLCNLTCNNAKNKTILCQLHGVQALLQAINNAGGREDIIEPAMCALRHITSRHPSAEMAQNTVRQVGGVPMVTAFLHQQCRWPLLKALVGLIRNLALCPENHFPLRQQTVIPKLWNILARAYTNSSKRGVPGGPQGFIDGVYMDEVVEVSVGALHLLARSPENRQTMRQLNTIRLFVQLLYSNNENITRVAAGVLCELAQDAEGAALIDRENASAPLRELLNSRNEAVAAYSAAVLFCLSEDANHHPHQPAISHLPHPAHMSLDPHGFLSAADGMSHGPVMPHHVTHNHFSAPHSHSNTGYNTPHGPVAQSGYNTPHGAMGYSHPSTGYNTPHSGIASGVMTPADLDLPLDFGFDDFPAGNGFQELPVASSQPPAITTLPPPTITTSQQQPQQHSQHYSPAQPQQVANMQQGSHSYNPPSPAVMDTSTGPWFDPDL